MPALTPPRSKEPVYPFGRTDCCERAGTGKNQPLQAVPLSRLERRGNNPAGLPGYEKADYDALMDVLARLNAERAELANGVKSEHPALVAFTKHQNIDQLFRELLVELIDHIKVYENGNISVRFKFADEFRRIAEYIEINTTKIRSSGLTPATYPLTVCFPNRS